MNLFLLNLLLGLGFAAVIGSFGVASLLGGFVVGYLALWATKPLYGETRYFNRSFATIRLGLYFLYELVVSSIRVAWDVITPRMRAEPGIIAVPLEARTDTEIMVLANLISLTPGTLSLDVAEDRSCLFVHAMFVDDEQALIDDIKSGMERRVLEALR
jgi:multicomponent Na+:H+ antiporter subunit E